MSSFKSVLSLALLVFFGSTFGAAQEKAAGTDADSRAAAQIDPTALASLKARRIGPAGMSGRIAAIDAVHADRNVIYVGAATGGLWKTTSGGTTWTPIFDDQPVSSIGAIAIDQSRPDVVWVGTGEGNPRNSSGVGNGVYRTMDGGRTWQHLGLERTEKIHRLVLHPTRSDVAWVAALGSTWGNSEARGVFKTMDGGRSWRQVLYVDETTGASDLVIDPANPNKLFATMWQHRRWPWFFESGGEGSGLYVSNDGGETWERRTADDGLPKGKLGRIGIAIARNRPNVVYALLEAKKSALCRSDDGGVTWKTVNDSPNIAPRPFYFCDIRVDPENENRVYSLHMLLEKSEDGGKSFQTLLPFARVHPDHHALWIHPKDGSFLIDGNDGGIAISTDRGGQWRFVENLPLAQFYHIHVDHDVPYHIYGGMQDNGSWRGPSRVWENGGIRNYHWMEVGFGDGFETLPDPDDSLRGYAMSQGGYLKRYDQRTGERKDIRPPPPGEETLRFNWNAPLAIDPFDAATIYYGSQFVHRSTDRGDTWEIISGDLTTDDPEKQKQDASGGLTRDVTTAENHVALLSIAPSAVERGVIWTGSDDGKVHVTRDGGDTWQDVTARIPGIPAGIWCSHIEASKFKGGSAFVVFDDHRRDDWTPFVFRTDDYGVTWRSLVANVRNGRAEPFGFVHVIEQDPVAEELLFLGTEFGLRVSVDGGANWFKWTHGVPTCPVRDLIVHPRDHDLVIGTHGRAAFIIDDIAPLRGLTAESLERAIGVFAVQPTHQHRVRQVDGYRFPADGMFRGDNRARGALITYVLNPPKDEKSATEEEDGEDEEKEKLVIEVRDAEGNVIRTIKRDPKPGLHRFGWNLRRDGFRSPRRDKAPGEPEGKGPAVLPGKYELRFVYRDLEAKTSVTVSPDPRVSFDGVAMRENHAMQFAVGQRIEVVTEALDRIRRQRRRMDAAVTLIEEQGETKEDAAKALAAARKTAFEALDRAADHFAPPTDRRGIHARGKSASSRLRSVARSLGSSWDRPTDAQRRYFAAAERTLDEALRHFNDVMAGPVTAFWELAKAQGGALDAGDGAPLEKTWRAGRD